MMSTLLLRFGAPLQSWGSSSVYDRRESDDMPTKSGVVGMLAAAFGRKRDESLEDLNALQFGVRVDLPGSRVNDFQITDMGEKLNKNISRRVYLSDALFLIGLSCEDEKFLEEVDKAVRNPQYPLFLGRRSCPPTMPLDLGIRQADLYEALYEEGWMVPEWREKEIFRTMREIRLRIVMDGSEDQGGRKKDLPVSFSPYKREYGYRYIVEKEPKIIKRGTDEIEHDPMKELG